jgi:hypothetical protein
MVTEKLNELKNPRAPLEHLENVRRARIDGLRSHRSKPYEPLPPWLITPAPPDCREDESW